MTFAEQAEVRRPSVGTKVLMVGLAVFAVLGSFWTIVWFIRAYVEAPRVNTAPMALVTRESTPVVPPAPSVVPAAAAAPQLSAPPPVIMAAPTTEPAPAAQAPPDTPAASNAISDRWLPVAPAAPSPAPAEPAPNTVPDAVATTMDSDPPADEVAESSIPAISGAAPLPRRKPTQTAAMRPRNSDPPLPRPRPDGPAPQSVWTAVPTTDDRYPGQ
jgi:cytoskeletal protein RodZ